MECLAFFPSQIEKHPVFKYCYQAISLPDIFLRIHKFLTWQTNFCPFCLDIQECLIARTDLFESNFSRVSQGRS